MDGRCSQITHGVGHTQIVLRSCAISGVSLVRYWRVGLVDTIDVARSPCGYSIALQWNALCDPKWPVLLNLCVGCGAGLT